MTRTTRMLRMLMTGSVVCGALVLTGGAQLVSTQGPQTAAAVLGAAIHQDDAEGNLDAAIEGYKKFLAQYGDNRPLAVQALLRMGQAYETLGRPEARDAYERVLRDYADQGETAAEARSRLAALEVEPTSPSPALHTELLWAEARGVSPQGGVSPDGSLVTYVDWLDGGNLAIRSLATGEHRRITHEADNGLHGAYNSRVSPDGEQVVYTWQRQSTGRIEESTGELRVLPLQGAQTEPRTVWSPTEGSWASIQDWFPSGDRVVATVRNPSNNYGSPKVHVGPELAEGAPGGPVTGAFPGFSLGVLVMGQGPVEARGKRAVFSKARWARLCVRGAGSFHRACPFVTSGPRGALLHLPRVQLVKSRCPYDLRCTCVIFQPERWGPNSQTLAPLRVRAHRGDHAL